MEPAPEKGESEKELFRSYLRLFKPWNWIVGNSVAIQDIEKDFLYSKMTMIENLNMITAKQSRRDSGYFFIFNEKNEILVHPTLAGTDGNIFIFPETGLKLLDEFKRVSHSDDNFLEYLWDKPGFEGEYRFKKVAYIIYQEAMGLYIARTHYTSVIEEDISTFTRRVNLFYLIFLFIALIFSIVISRSIIAPLNRLVFSISKTDKEGLPLENIRSEEITEIKLLGTSINTMLDSIRRSRKELKVQRDFSKDIVNGSSNIICVLDGDGTMTFINPSGERITGYKKGELIGQNWWDLFYPGEERHQVESLMKILNTGKFINHEMSLINKDGEKVDIVWNGIIKTDRNNNILRITCFGFDITDRKRLEDRAKKIFNNSHDAIYIHDLDGKILDVNDRACSMIGVTKKELFALTIAELSSPELSMDFAAQKWKQALDGDPAVFEWKTVCPLDKYTFDTEISLQRISFYERDVIVGHVRDITERKQSEEALRLQSAELAETNKELTKHKENLEDLVNEKTQELKDSLVTLKKTQEELIQREKMASLGLLVAGIAHEINTPVGIGVTSASHLKDKTEEFFGIYKSGKLSRGDFESYSTVARESTKMILANLERAADLIHSFKQVAVDQSSKEQREFKIKEYIEEILLSLRPKFKKTMHEIEVDCPSEIIINSFPGAFSQILTNLLMNSLNHGFEDIEKGKITIKIIKRDERVVLIYEDNGKGIPEKNLNKIFEPFFTTKRGQGGSGLGMHIVFNLVTQTLKGTIECRSIVGKGTIFEIEFPFNVES